MESASFITRDGIKVNLQESIENLNYYNLEFWKNNDPASRKKLAVCLLRELSYMKELGVRHTFNTVPFLKYIEQNTEKPFMLEMYKLLSEEVAKFKKHNKEDSAKQTGEIFFVINPNILQLVLPSDKYFEFYNTQVKRFSFQTGVLRDIITPDFHYYLTSIYTKF